MRTGIIDRMLRDRRIILLLVAVGVAALAVAVLVLVGSGGDDSDATRTAAAAGDISASETLLAHIPQNGIHLGKTTTPVTVIEFADPQCPACAQWSNTVFPTVVRQFVRPGKIRLEYRGLHFLGDDSLTALQAIEAAGLQDKLWNMNESLYAQQGAENSGWVTETALREIGATVPGLDVDQMLDDADSARVDAQVKAASAKAVELNVRGTPSFFVQRPLSTPVPVEFTSFDPVEFAAALERAIAGS